MDKDSVNLLKECNLGCKMAIESMEQVKSYIKDIELQKLIDNVNENHMKINCEIEKKLAECDETEKSPSGIAKAFSYMSTEIKLMMNSDSSKIAKIMMDGCNMGIQSLAENINKYPNASKESVLFAKQIIKLEEDFMDDLKQFL